MSNHRLPPDPRRASAPTRARRARPAAALALGAVLALGAGSGVSSRASAQAAAHPGRRPPVVRLAVSDSGVSVPDILPSGLVRLRLVARGSRAHRIVLSRLRPRQSATGYLSGAEGWLEGGHFDLWGEDPGSPGLVTPGDSADVVVRLHPGRYVAAAWAEGPKGSVRIRSSTRATFEVLEPPDGVPPAQAPDADLTVEMTDYDYHLSGPLTPGRHVIEVINRGPQEHDLALARLVGGATEAGARAWLQDGMRGPAPVEFVGGLVAMSPGHRGWMEVTLAPGRYVLLCLVPDVSDRKPHVDHGMLTSVRVPPAGGVPADGGP